MTRSPQLTLISTSRDAAAAPRRLGFADVLRRPVVLVRAWIDLSRQRRALADLDDHLLRDINVTHAAARREAARSYWDY